jgi:glycosyltransferase involved in cell wall biosynthesis
VKVAFVTYDAPEDIGGVSTWMQRTLPLLQAAGVEVEVHIMVFGGRPGPNCAFYNEHGIPFRWLPWQEHLPYGVRSCLKLLQHSQPDVYVPNCIVPAYFAAGYARRSGIATVGVLHADNPYYWGLVDEFINASPNFRLSAVVPVSSFIESKVTSMAAAQGILVRRIGCGVPIPEKSASVPESMFRLVYVGRLVEEQKRISDVVAALCEVARRIPNLEAWIVGGGSASNKVACIIQQNAMGARIRLLGRIDNANIDEVLVQCHGLVLLSDYEGLSLSMLEAMAAGVVPICLDMRSGVREALEHEVNGLIVKDRGEDFFNAVKALQRNPAKWQQLSIAARQTVRQRYSVRNCVQQWMDLLHGLERTKIAAFKAPRTLRLPPPNPKFGSLGKLVPWQKRFQDYTTTNPAIRNVTKAVLPIGRKVRSLYPRLAFRKNYLD